MKLPHVTVTDHMLLRYLERVRGIDVEAIRDEIANLCRPAVAIGAKSISSGGFNFKLYGNTVKTVTPGESPSQSYRLSRIHNGEGVRRFRRPEGKRP